MKHVFLNEITPSAGSQQTLDAPANHPADGVLRGYLVRVIGTVVAASSVTPTWENWRDTILETVVSSLQLFAPRYSQQLCSANLTGGFFAKMYEDHYGEAIPIEVNNSPVTQIAGVAISTTPLAFQADIVIPFELPKLGDDRLWSCPSCLLFRGDVTLKCTWTAAVTVQSVALTFSAITFRWLAMQEYGDTATLGVIHRFERRTYSKNSVDVGRGFPIFITDNRAPDQSNQYNLFVDGESVHNGALYGEDYSAVYRILNKDLVPETSVYTPLVYLPENSNVNSLCFAERSVAFQFQGISSGTFDIHTIEPAGGMPKAALKSALGIPASTAIACVPKAPNSTPLGNVVKKIALNGPRIMLVRDGNGAAAVRAVAPKTVPTVPSGTTGAGIASAVIGGGQ